MASESAQRNILYVGGALFGPSGYFVGLGALVGHFFLPAAAILTGAAVGALYGLMFGGAIAVFILALQSFGGKKLIYTHETGEKPSVLKNVLLVLVGTISFAFLGIACGGTIGSFLAMGTFLGIAYGAAIGAGIGIPLVLLLLWLITHKNRRLREQWLASLLTVFAAMTIGVMVGGFALMLGAQIALAVGSILISGGVGLAIGCVFIVVRHYFLSGEKNLIKKDMALFAFAGLGVGALLGTMAISWPIWGTLLGLAAGAVVGAAAYKIGCWAIEEHDVAKSSIASAITLTVAGAVLSVIFIHIPGVAPLLIGAIGAAGGASLTPMFSKLMTWAADREYVNASYLGTSACAVISNCSSVGALIGNFLIPIPGGVFLGMAAGFLVGAIACYLASKFIFVDDIEEPDGISHPTEIIYSETTMENPPSTTLNLLPRSDIYSSSEYEEPGSYDDGSCYRDEVDIGYGQ